MRLNDTCHPIQGPQSIPTGSHQSPDRSKQSYLEEAWQDLGKLGTQHNASCQPAPEARRYYVVCSNCWCQTMTNGLSGTMESNTLKRFDHISESCACESHSEWDTCSIDR